LERRLIGFYCSRAPAPCQDRTANERGSSCSCSARHNNGVVGGSAKPPAHQPPHGHPPSSPTAPTQPQGLQQRGFFACLFPRQAHGAWQSRVPWSPRCRLPARSQLQQQRSPDSDGLPFPPLLRVTGPGASLALRRVNSTRSVPLREAKDTDKTGAR